MFPSKADLILSRYRPIAPKPSPFPPAAPPSSTDPSSTCDSFASSGKSRRARKRRGDGAPSCSSKSAKLTKSDRSRVPSSAAPSTTAGGSSLTHGTSDLCAVPSRDPGGSVCQTSQRSQGPGLCVDDPAEVSGPVLGLVADGADLGRAGGAPCVVHVVDSAVARLQRLSPAYMSSAGLLEKDAAFMERAAANSPSTDLGDRAMACGSTSKGGSKVGGFTEMIRGITRLPTAADVHSLMQVRIATESRMRSPPAASWTWSRRSEPQLASPPLSSFCEAAQAPAAAASAGESTEPRLRDPKLVTLPLLPETPLRSDSPTESSLSTCTSLAAISGDPSKKHGGLEHLELGWSNAIGLRLSGSCSTAAAASLHGSVIDEAYLQQVYGGSTDPVVLVGRGNQVLWFNRAYERASKTSIERMSGKIAPSGPYIDPLGHPTPLGSFALQSHKQAMPSSATLWGFLKKLVQEPELLKEDCGAYFDLSSASDSLSSLSVRLGEADISSIGQQQQQRSLAFPCKARSAAAVVPDASQMRGSTVTLESVTEVELNAAPLSDSLAAVEARLAVSALPAFVTDCTNKVRWLNSAFLNLMQQQQQEQGCSRLASSSSSGSGKGDPPQPAAAAAADVTFVFSGEKIPRAAAAFACRVNLQWMKAGVRSSMTVPCDVCRLVTGSRAEMWVWKFDVAASLRL